jgi:hypothetical protein
MNAALLGVFQVTLFCPDCAEQETRLQDFTVELVSYIQGTAIMKKESILRKGHLCKTREQLDKTKNSIVFRKKVRLIFFMEMKLDSWIFCFVISMHENILTCTCVPQRQIPKNVLLEKLKIFRCHAKRILAYLCLMHVCPAKLFFIIPARCNFFSLSVTSTDRGTEKTSLQFV